MMVAATSILIFRKLASSVSKSDLWKSISDSGVLRARKLGLWESIFWEPI